VTSTDPQVGLARRLGTTSAVMVTVGAVIGSGIFLKPLDIANSLPNPMWIHAAWIALGVVCLFGAFAYAELGAMFPEAGGQYAFLREGYGKGIAFLYGWCFLLVINTGTLAALAVAFADQFRALSPMGDMMHLLSAAAMILLLAVVNHFGVGIGALVQNVSTFAKLLALAALVAGGMLIFGGSDGGANAAAAAAAANAPQLSIVTGLLAIFWAYEGWYQLPFNAAELEHPERDLPRGLIWGMLILIATYALVNAAYLHVVPIEEMRGFAAKEAVPRTFVERVFGSGSANLLTVLICVSVFGAANPNLLSSPRAFYAMAQDGLMPRVLTRVHRRWQTPTVAIWTQALWAVLLVWCLQNFKDITEFVVFAALLFYALTVAAVYVLRARLPDRPRPYRCGAYPIGPAVFIVVVLAVDLWMLREPENRMNALWGTLIILSGVPVYWLMRRRPR
jgi:APA family basic amino acid/polyamine antiporter